MSTKHKLYPIHQSPFYKILGLGQLEKVLDIDLARLKQLLAPDNYRVWKNSRGREIQQPIRWLGRVHQKIGDLLSRVCVPDYVMSRRGHSYIDNARRHLGHLPLGKTDVARFYPSTTHLMVKDMFVREFRCARDVAAILANVCCFEGKHLPTGSPISGRIAYLAAKTMFDEIHELARMTGSRMTVYVDDVTLSGPAVTKRLISEVRRIIRKHGLKTKEAKTKTFPANAPKTVTGAVVVGGQLRLPNTRHRKIWEARRALKTATGEEKKKIVQSLRGRLQEAKQL